MTSGSLDRVVVTVPGTPPSPLSVAPVGEKKAWSVLPQSRSSLAEGSSGERAHALTRRAAIARPVKAYSGSRK
jgi:hypothetical protein